MASYDSVLKCINLMLPKSRGLSTDQIHLRHLTDVLPFLTSFLSKLFHSIPKTNIYPDVWKIAHIVPLSKKPNPTFPHDTRPIVNLPHLAKVFDKFIGPQLVQFFECNKIYISCQSGFRAGFSTQTALLNIMGRCREAFAIGKISILVLFDFSLTFNHVDHTILFTILRQHNFSDDLRMLHSYLPLMSFLLDDATPGIFTCGVSQGSGPGGNLFLLKLNLVFNRVFNCCLSLFADDMQTLIHSTVSELPQTLAKINFDITGIVAWSREVGLILNPNKTQFIILGSNTNLKKIKECQLPSLVVDNQVITPVSSVKSLGVIISDYLTWNDHVNFILSKIQSNLFFLYNKCFTFPIRTKITCHFNNFSDF